MSKLSANIAVKIAIIVLLAILGGIAIAQSVYWLAGICLFLVIYQAYSLYRLNMKAVRQFTFFTDSIRFSESNIGFNTSVSDSVYDEYYTALNKSVDKFNALTRKREAEAGFYNNLLNRIDFALIVINEREDIVWINKAALDMLGRPKPKSLKEVKYISESIYDTLINLPDKSGRIVKLYRNGKPKNVVVNLSHISISNEQFKIFSFKDIQPVVEEVEGSAWQQLISVLTHEMMNSLAPIISLSDTFSGSGETYEPEMMSKAMQTIHRRSKGLVTFVDNYKKIMQIPNPNRQRIELKPLFEDITALFLSQKVIVKTLVTSGDIYIYADRGQMDQVLINLLKNAWEACSGEEDYEIKLTAMEDTDGKILISVSDDGCGITPDILGRIFVPFYTTKPDGSGVGLSICRQIVTLHGGTLTVVSQPDKGSVFTIAI